MEKNRLNALPKYRWKGLLNRLSKEVLLFQPVSKSLYITSFFICLAERRFRIILAIIGIILTSGCQAGNDSPYIFTKLLVEYAENPIQIDELHPRFSWIISSGKRNQTQSAFRILVATTPEALAGNRADLWDSGTIRSGETIQHEYNGNELKSNSAYYWKVIFRDGEGKPHESPVAKFETSFLSEKDWKADCIGNGSKSELLPPQGFYKDRKEQFAGKDSIVHDGNSLLLRREVKLNKTVKSARAYITGLGYYEFYINGARVGDHVLAPAKTPYHKMILYDTYDVTDLLRKGINALGIHLGNGWYNPYKKWWNDYRMQWFGSKKTIAQIHLTFSDGSTRIITTDKDWLYAPGPVIYNCIYDGEVYDGNLDHLGWNKPGYNDSLWKPVTVFDKPTARLASHRMPAIKVMETFKPTEVKVRDTEMKVYDMGQNFSGWVRIKTKGKKNTILKIRFAEDLKEDGTIDVTSNEHANATAEYIIKGDSIETYEPRFTWFGFKYVEITARNGLLNILGIEGCAVSSANHHSGQFECDNLLVNKIHNATVWSQKSNMMGYPMDCPQRDERLGWFGDAQVTAEEAMFNFDMALFYENWFEGIRVNQDEKTGDIPIISPRPYIRDEGIEWSSTYLIMLWQYYTFYGDQRILARHYGAMKHYMSFLEGISKDFILPKGWIGDWGSMVKGWKEGEPESIPTAFYFLNARIMSKVATVLGNNSDKIYYNDLSDKIREKYNKTNLNSVTANYGDASQMANSFPLFLGIVPKELEGKVLVNLVNDIVLKNSTHLTTGVLGTKYVPEALAHYGHSEVAWAIINQKSAPGWNDMMNKYSTMCEFWTLKQSKNHVMMGSIDAWFYKYITGIQLDENHPAFSEFYIKPMLPEGPGSAKARIETMRGTISSSWERSNGQFSLKLEVPFNTSAIVQMPAGETDLVSEGEIPVEKAVGVEILGYKEGAHVLKVHSGIYSFKVSKN